tara:strand:- start:453 stop:1553 length:1101 start_codon:yes stop_codon:yes gene_type:complete
MPNTLDMFNETEYLDKLYFQVFQGNNLNILNKLHPIHCVITSPPYFSKREYGDSNLEIGHEKTIDEYVCKLCDVFDAVPLHSCGSVWVNIGDTRSSNGLLMIPERLALEMTRRKWNLIDTIIWVKQVVNVDGTTIGGCMPEPALDRLNGNAYEYLYRFTKNKLAWTDTAAVRIPRQEKDLDMPNGRNTRYLPESLMQAETSVEGRNLSNVWRIPPGQTSLKHYAVFNPVICERAIAMTCPMFVNSDGNPTKRIVEMQEYDEGRIGKRVFGKYNSDGRSGRQDTGGKYIPRKPVTTGWEKINENWTTGIVLDPFCGSGTAGEVALKIGRSFIGIDLYEQYCKLTRKKCTDAMHFLQKSKLNPFKEFK